MNTAFAVESAENDNTADKTPLTSGKLNGDANCDSSVDMSDVVLVMLALANPNKYGLEGTEKSHITETGWELADVDRSSEGVTSNDALRIQEYLLKKIDNLYPSEK